MPRPNLIAFEWRAPKQGGFSWRPAERPTAKGTQLESMLSPASVRGWRYYDALRESADIYLRFAETLPTEEGVIQFANRFGALGADELAHDRLAGVQMRLERLSTWRQEIVTMQHAVEIWRAITHGHTKRLAAWFTLAENRDISTLVYNQWPDDVPIVAVQWPGRTGRWMRFAVGIGVRGDPTSTTPPKNPAEQARAFLYHVVNKRLGEHLTGVLSPIQRGRLPLSTLRLSLVPRTLLGAIWLTFAQAIDGSLDIRRCAHRECAQWFEVSGRMGGKKRGATYCSDRCRLRAWRGR